VQFFFEELFQQIIESFSFWVHTRLQTLLVSDFSTQSFDKVSEYYNRLIKEPKKSVEFFFERLLQHIITSFSFWLHTRLHKLIVSDFSTQNLEKVLDYNENFSGFFFWRGYTCKLLNFLVFQIRVVSDFSTRNLYKVSDYDYMLIKEPKKLFQWIVESFSFWVHGKSVSHPELKGLNRQRCIILDGSLHGQPNFEFLTHLTGNTVMSTVANITYSRHFSRS
jgi:hypothetical protein